MDQDKFTIVVKKQPKKKNKPEKLTNNDFVYEMQHIITMVNYIYKNL